MDRLGHQLLAAARLALDQHRGVRGRDPLQPGDNVVHLGTIPDDTFETESLV